MKNVKPQAIYLQDYEQPAFLIEDVSMHVDIYEDETFVSSTLNIVRNGMHKKPLILDGEELELLEIKLDNAFLSNELYKIDSEHLVVAVVPNKFVLMTRVKIYPQNNTHLAGLYKSKGIYCTQCESLGFRRITYFIDRPDVLTNFTVKISAPHNYPTLLSNGNLIEQSVGDDGRNWVLWHDPSLKPCYLFALVVGNLEYIEDNFVTKSGTAVVLRAYTEYGYKEQCWHALRSLQRAMQWDEKIFNCEYDLEIYMIVAIHDFNNGAMENKGLNIFNTKFILANSETATDSDYINIENVVAHEYFHNWTGNRITCRDWFQLSLKEGLTVFRDQWFTADQTSHAVKLIEDANIIRSSQFVEDAGPMSHPVQPKSYVAIDNFYTLTVYHKGAEVIRMLYTILGNDDFMRGMQLYFSKFDGKAVTIEDFLFAMQAAAKIDLTQFYQWYHKSGTPTLTVTDRYDEVEKQYILSVTQDMSMFIPLKIGLIDKNGDDIPLQLIDDSSVEMERIIYVNKDKQDFVFVNIDSKPIPSLLRDFSAPVKLDYPYSQADLLFLLQHDSNPFCRWNAGQQVAVNLVFKLLGDYYNQNKLHLDSDYIEALRSILLDNISDKMFTALLLTFPTHAYIFELMTSVDIDAVFHVTEFIKTEIAKNLYKDLLNCYNSNNEKNYKFNNAAIGKRRLKNTCLFYLSYCNNRDVVNLCTEQFYHADNMTDVLASLSVLTNMGVPEREQAFRYFYDKWKDDELLIDQWLALQAASKLPNCLEIVKELVVSDIFDLRNPNNVYALIRTFAKQNIVNFHLANGAGYQFLADQILRLDKINPQVSGRLATGLIHWRKFDSGRRQLMQEQLRRIKNYAGISKNVYEVVDNGLKE